MPIKNQKPGMVSPLDRADGMVVTTPNINSFSKNQIVKMIPIKFNLGSSKNIDFMQK